MFIIFLFFFSPFACNYISIFIALIFTLNFLIENISLPVVLYTVVYVTKKREVVNDAIFEPKTSPRPGRVKI